MAAMRKYPYLIEGGTKRHVPKGLAGCTAILDWGVRWMERVRGKERSRNCGRTLLLSTTVGYLKGKRALPSCGIYLRKIILGSDPGY